MIEGQWLDGARWHAALDALGPALTDVYFSPAYHELHERNGDGRACCFGVTDGDARLLVPGLRVALGAAAGSADLQSCNGYGGPLASPGADTAFLERAWASWREAARQDGIVAALFRLHPLLDNRRWLPADAVVRRERNTVFIDLAAGREAAWQSADARHRNMVSKARRAGATVTWGAEGAWDDFVALYRPAMARLGAASSLDFSDEYFSGLRTLDAEVAILADERGPAAGAIFLWSPRFGHYHLAARRTDAPNFATNLVLQAAIDRAADRGLAGVHLGGATTNDPDDSLFRFKRSIGGRLLDFEVALVVADEPAYRALIAERTARTGTAPTWLLGYRQPG